MSAEHGEEYLEMLAGLGGYYECPKDANGKRLGPLVGYAGRDSQGRQYVGDVYANFAKLEERPLKLYQAATRLSGNLARDLEGVDVFCGMPMGGIAFAQMLGLVCGRRFVYPEKKITGLATEHSREESKLVFGRHEICKGERVAVTEDVLNNFSTTESAIGLIEEHGGHVVMIVGFLNRSLEHENTYLCKRGSRLPIISLVRKRIMQYEQDDPAVDEDVWVGNVVWKPKDNWSSLKVRKEP